MAVDLRDFCLGPGASVRDVIELIDRNQRGVALVVDEAGLLLHIVTDGDLRRAFYRGVALNASVSEVLPKIKPEENRVPVSARAGTAPAELVNLFEAHSVRHLPLVDAAGRVLDIVFRSDLLGIGDPIQAVIMAGGLGSRMRPLTNEVPKPMLHVGDRPLLEHLIHQIRGSGIRKVNITTNYHPDKIRRHFGDGGTFGLDVTYISEQEPLGTAGGLRLLRPQQDAPLLVVNGDILTNVNFRAMLEYHDDHRASVTLGVATHEVPIPFGVVETDGDHVSAISEKPVYRYFVNAGVYVINPDVLDMIPERNRFDMTDLIALLIEKGARVVPFPITEYWLDVGRLEDFETAQQDFLNGRFKS